MYGMNRITDYETKKALANALNDGYANIFQWTPRLTVAILRFPLSFGSQSVVNVLLGYDEWKLSVLLLHLILSLYKDFDIKFHVSRTLYVLRVV